MSEIKNLMTNLELNHKDRVSAFDFLNDAKILLQNVDDVSFNDVKKFLTIYADTVQMYGGGILLPNHAYNGPMNSREGFLTVIQITFNTLYKNRNGKHFTDFKS